MVSVYKKNQNRKNHFLIKSMLFFLGENEYDIDVAILHNLVLDKPQVNIHTVVPVGTDKIYFNWTVTDWNSPVTDYFLSVRALFKYLSITEMGKLHP